MSGITALFLGSCLYVETPYTGCLFGKAALSVLRIEFQTAWLLNI